MEDTYIIDLFWRRDENAIQLVDKKYNSTCYSIAWKILMNREDSEECVHGLRHGGISHPKGRQNW